MLALLVLFLGVTASWGAENDSTTNYTIESHSVVTSDGYILGVQHITGGKISQSGNRKVVFLMHGLGADSTGFTLAGPQYAIGYNLAFAGFDVWMGNARGNTFSRRHVSLDPDRNSTQFFDFSYEEIGLRDLPAMFDFVLNKTGQKHFYYIGHSQGGTVFFVLNSLNSTYHSKIASAHLLTGVGYEDNFPNKNISTLCKGIDGIYTVFQVAGQAEATLSNLALATMEVLVGTPIPAGVYSGAAVKQFVHFCQNFRDNAFRRFIYNSATNQKLYGSATPPAYDLSQINIDVTLHYSLGDATQSEKDALAMANAMPKARARKVARETFSHLDYLAAPDAKKLVTDYIIQCIKAS